ncbi:Glycosyltransferase, catalytic subunit of cellulose synthase and poly-beta-1,6-N-acetylglucosamine synthase [Roseovarius nanhaiticus]|uniref:Glycosyltransferase, catalytic subunit of cellulose synthase and poly-beta-1,6-N-acetylglucosamine synthase n=1 Tax=Roseovarius nanhaiticus TaxID=573024 RepID=A0A1N7EU68_9RHOB|nr:glycosyltransferase family 2 protein [Roseovarius nanhaiticus]SEK66676.1 Glycosyltransferase, catalytic subunit of cellulose synthase and poly-beta-1,6-N-acetylglucosamine synthase [Roseovarius nanhaiticus]SIR91597.1 Glycosyltransferase, catalytic subunit of cellulose synthase and poly-beta-1,6-N-acetylglucosamine synthase [Roseovarius nanhaiticus]
MSISDLRQLDTQSWTSASLREGADDVAPLCTLGLHLVRTGTISSSDAKLAQIVGRHCAAPIDDILRAEGLLDESTVLRAQASRAGLRQASAHELAHCAEPVPGIDPRRMIRSGAAALRGEDGVLRIAVDRPEAAEALGDLPDALRRRAPLIAPRHALQDAMADAARTALTAAAEARPPASESCRTWRASPMRRGAIALSIIGLCILASALWPAQIFGLFVAWATVTLFLSAAFKMAAVCARAVAGAPAEFQPPLPANAKLPKVSILVPLYRETRIAQALIKRLSLLTYPKCLLDVILVLEETDETTRSTVAGITLPPWMRAVIVPDGQPRTKPRAMNYALDFCEGSIVGIFDAEDAPAPDQITQIARRFAAAPPDVVCLQGILDYYNPRQNWLARCFTIEYATWFRVMLPGMAKLGLAIPLGGTTLYFRRDVLEELGGWDAHNVTEDADLGFRLARHGYRTEVIGTVTGEEANCSAWPWIKQRSRWLKGYMTTYLVHMRRPRLLHQQLGAWRFWGFQAHFLTALSQFLLAPFLWSFWLVLFGLPHPLDPVLPREGLLLFSKLFLAVELLNIGFYMLGVSGKRHRHLLPWAPLMHLYTPLGTIAALKAIYEMIVAPFYWDKTAHGHSLESAEG